MAKTRVKDFPVQHTTRATGHSPFLPLPARNAVSFFAAAFIVLAASAPSFAQPLAPAAEEKEEAKPAAAAATEAAPAAAQPDSDAAKRRAQMQIKKPLMTLKEDDKKRKRILLKIRKILRDGVLNAESRAAIDEWVAWRLERMTITELPPKPKDPPAPRPRRDPTPDPAGGLAGPPMGRDAFGATAEPPPQVPLPPLPYVRRLPEFRKDFRQEIRAAANPKFQPNPGAAEAFRKYVLDQIIAKSRELFDNNFYVRLNVVYLLADLDLVEGSRNNKPVAYAPVSAPLLEIVRSDDQLAAVKIAAVLGLRRVLLFGQPDRDLTNEIALELMNQLEQPDSHEWYQMRLAETLGWVAEPLISRTVEGSATPQQHPFHVQTLMEVMRDQNRDCTVRTQAARSLGRIPLHSSVSSTLIAYEIVVLDEQLMLAYNKAPGKASWNQCFVNVYLAFKALDREEKTQVDQVKPATLISKLEAQKSVSDAYRQVLPSVLHVLKQPEVVDGKRINAPFAQAAIEAIDGWVKENKPSINRVAPGLPPLEAVQPMAARTGLAAQPAALVSE